MQELIDIIIGVFFALFPLFFLFMRRRRRIAARTAAAEARMGPAAGETGPAADNSELLDAYLSADRGYPSVAPHLRQGQTAEVPDDSVLSSLTATVSPQPDQVRPATIGRSWSRINRLPAGKRAILLAEVISRPLALRGQDRIEGV